MIFLIDYDRQEGRIVAPHEFDDSQLKEAKSSRLEIELAQNAQGVEREVVLLQAASKADLKRTHNRYFADLGELLKAGVATIGN